MAYRNKKRNDFNAHTNYRQYYKDYYGIQFGDDYEVHHINLNRDCNEIWNLLLLPKELHRDYHSLLNEIATFCSSAEDVQSRLLLTKRNIAPAYSLSFDMAAILEEADYWVSLKKSGYRWNGEDESFFNGGRD